MNTFFILWFMIGANTHTLNLLKFDTEAECLAAGEAIVRAYNVGREWTNLDFNTFKCIKVE